jgi:phospholipid transport system substrate-binding protein
MQNSPYSQNSINLLRRLALSVLLVLVFSARFVYASLTPTEMIEATISKAAFALKKANGSQAEKWEAIGIIIDQSFDFRSMTQNPLSEDWKMASMEERRLFVSFFSQYLEDTYRNNLILTGDQAIKILSEQVRRTRAVVETMVSSSSKSVQVTYRLKDNGGVWFVYDVLVSGVSVVDEAREMFDAIIKAEGIDGMKDDLENRVNIYKKKYGALPDLS